MFITAHVGEFTPGEHYPSSLGSHWLPVALHIGVGPYEMSPPTLECQLVLSSCRSCLGNHIIDDKKKKAEMEAFLSWHHELPSRSLIDNSLNPGSRILKHYKIVIYPEAFLQRTRACHCPLLEESIQTCLSITWPGKMSMRKSVCSKSLKNSCTSCLNCRPAQWSLWPHQLSSLDIVPCWTLQ